MVFMRQDTRDHEPALESTPDPTPGYVQALDALHRHVAQGRLVASRSGHVLASADAIPGAPRGPLSRFGLAVSAIGPVSAGCPVSAGGSVSADRTAQAVRRFARGLLDLHHELLEHALRQVMRQLGARTSGGTTLLAKELIQAQLAEIAMRLSEDKEMLAGLRDADPWAGWHTHLRQVAVGRGLLRLSGASGFLADGLGRDLHLAEVTGNVYLHPGLTSPRDGEER
jgi:hypothetical protein